MRQEPWLHHRTRTPWTPFIIPHLFRAFWDQLSFNPLRHLESFYFLPLWDCLCLWSLRLNLLWPMFPSSFGFLQSHFNLVLLLEHSRKYKALDSSSTPVLSSTWLLIGQNNANTDFYWSNAWPGTSDALSGPAVVVVSQKLELNLPITFFWDNLLTQILFKLDLCVFKDIFSNFELSTLSTTRFPVASDREQS